VALQLGDLAGCSQFPTVKNVTNGRSEDIGVVGRIILKWILEEKGLSSGMDSYGSG
jgi:hypothetical protein